MVFKLGLIVFLKVVPLDDKSTMALESIKKEVCNLNYDCYNYFSEQRSTC